MSYKKVGWEDTPSSNTPILSVSLNQMDDGIEKANKGIVFSYSATFTSDGVLKNTTSTEALGAGDFATSQTDIVTVFVADNVTKINNGAFSNCTSLKTIYIDNTVGNVDIVTGAVPSGVSIVYSNDENFINVNELLASAIRSLKSLVNTNRTDWENRATTIEQQASSDKAELSQTIQKVKESALEEFANVKADLDKKENVSNKVNTIDFPSTTYYPSSKAVWDYVTSKLSALINDIENLKNNKANITDFNIFKDSTNSNIFTNSTNIENLKNELAEKNKKINDLSIKVTTDKAGNTTISDSSNNNIVGLNMYGKTTQSTTPTPTNPVAIKDINNPKITVTNDSDSQSINIQCTLRGIGNVCDTLTVNSNGTGYITQRLFAERITSQRKSTSLEWNYSKTTHRFFRNDYSYSFDVKDNKPLILCSHLDVGENEKNTAFDNSIGWINVSGVGIAIRMTEFDGDIAKFKKWLDDNEVYVVAPRSKPITVNLSKDEVDKILSLHTYYPSTTIVADCDCEVEYVADTKTYIDNKFNELATALVAHESEVM